MELIMISILAALLAFEGWLVLGLYRDRNKDIDVIAKALSSLRSRIEKKENSLGKLAEDNLELYGEIGLLRKKLELLEEIQTHLSPKKQEKQEPKKRDQKEKAIKLINEALTYAPHTFSELVMLLDENDVSLKKSTVGVYLSNDDRFESKNGKWQLKESNESPSV